MGATVGVPYPIGAFVPDENNNTPNPTPQFRRRGAGYIAILSMLLMFMIFNAGNMLAKERPVAIPTSDFVTAVKEDRVTEVTYKVEGKSLTGKYYATSGDKKENHLSSFTSTYVGEDNLEELMAKHSGVKFDVDTSTSELWQTLLVSVVPTVIMIGIIVYFMNQMQG